MSEDMKNASVESADIITHGEASSKEEEKCARCSSWKTLPKITSWART